MKRIWIEEDDETTRENLCDLLRVNGYEPVDSPPCDLAILDVNLPEEDGFSRCRRFRQTCDAPVVFLTARTGAEDEIRAFGAGAADYVKKPFHPMVLLARIARLLSSPVRPLSVRELTLDEASFTLSYRKKSVALTKNEVRILRILMRRELCKKEEIVEELWAEGIYLDENALYVNINRLREKIRSLGAEEFLTTVRGVGYRL